MAVQETPAERLDDAIHMRATAMENYVDARKKFEDASLERVKIDCEKFIGNAWVNETDRLLQNYFKWNIIHKRIKLDLTADENWIEIPLLGGSLTINAATPDEVSLISGFMTRRKAYIDGIVNEMDLKDEALFQDSAASNEALAVEFNAESNMRLARMNALFAGIERKFSYLLYLLSGPSESSGQTGGV